MASVITTAFENWKAQEAASGKAVLLDEFVFANVPNLDPTKPIDRNEKLPPANQIVHRQAVNKAGLASENAVAYSVTMGADVGNFDFNWIGLLNKASGTVAMITHAPTQKKLKTQNGQQGNVLTRSFILEFQGAAEETQIKTSAETWQIDFTARLSGIDEMQRLINVDSYGAAAFFNDGFEVMRSGEQFTVKKGLGYVGGLRGELTQNQILNGLRNIKVYADFSYQGNIVSQWNTVIKITAAATLNNYVDAAGFTHQVFAIASIDANGNVKDLRPKGALSSQEISALETRFRLDLSKKIDKANITHQIGDSKELVPSQWLLSDVLGNYIKLGQFGIGTKSSAQPTKYARDWDTNGFWSGEASNGTTVVMGFSVNIQNSAYGFNFYARNSKIYYTCTENGVKGKETQVWTENNFTPTEYVLLNDMNTELAKKQPVGNYIKLGEFGIGTSSAASLTPYAKDWNKNGFFNGAMNNSSSVVFGISCNHLDGLYGFNIYGRNKRVLFSTRENGVDSVIDGIFYTSENTTKDRNGYLRSSDSTVEMQGVPIGGSIIWNSTAPIPDNFWPNEGRAFSAAEYPELAKIFPTLKLPDDRGYAIRIADNGRGIDAGRVVGTYQDDAQQKVEGEIIANIGGSATGAFSYKPNGTRAEGGLTPGGIWKLDTSTQVRTANETRMKNVAKILITRVK